MNARVILARLAKWLEQDKSRSVEYVLRQCELYGLYWQIRLVPGVVCQGRERRKGEPDTEPGRRSRFLATTGDVNGMLELIDHALHLHNELFAREE